MKYAIYFCLLYSMLLKFYIESSKQMHFVVGRLFLGLWHIHTVKAAHLC